MAEIYLIPNTNTTTVYYTNGAIWVGGVAPTNSADIAHLLNASVRFDAGLTEAGGTAVRNAKIIVYDTFEGYFGGVGTNKLQIQTNNLIIHRKSGTTSGNGAGVINLDLRTDGTNGTNVVIEGSRTPPGNSSDAGLPVIRLLSQTAASTLTVLAGSVGSCVNAISETSSWGTVTLSGASAKVKLGSGNTLSALKVSNGELEVNSAVSTLEQSGGKVITSGDWLMGTATLGGGTLFANHRRSGAEISNLKLQGGKLDLSQTGDAFACTATVLSKGSIVLQNTSQFAPGTLTLDFKEMRTLSTSLAA